jgi:hypothetical protein
MLTDKEKQYALATIKETRRELDELRANGFCAHGIRVSGCGYDYLCGYCESGEAWLSVYELTAQAVKHFRRKNGFDFLRANIDNLSNSDIARIVLNLR